eukprot:evm.model.scf_1436.4 EVM.evm.TU.scf_1436.4   scf_1436:33467-34132(+)
MHAFDALQSRSGSPCGGGPAPGEAPARSMAVLLSKRAVACRVVLMYGAISALVVALALLGGRPGLFAAFGVLVVAMPHIFRGAALLYERRPVLVVDAESGLSIRRPALLGERFAPFGPEVRVAWDEIDRWEACSVIDPCGLPPRDGVLKVYLRDAGGFVARQGLLWGRLRFWWKGLRHGTPLVVSDAVLRDSSRAVAQFMDAARGEGEGCPPQVPSLVVER